MQNEIDEGRKLVRKMERQCIEEENFNMGVEFFKQQVRAIKYTSHSDFHKKVWDLVEEGKSYEKEQLRSPLDAQLDQLDAPLDSQLDAQLRAPLGAHLSVENDCPKCGHIMCGKTPDVPWHIVYMCDECGYQEGDNEIIIG